MDVKQRLFDLYNVTYIPEDTKKCFFRALYKKIKKHPEQLEQALIKYKMHLNHGFLSLDDAKRSARLLVSNHLYIMLQQLQHYIDHMTGDFVVQKNNYEKAFCNLVGWQAIKLDKKTAKRCIKLFKQQTRRLNMQASATKNDLKAMASYVIQRIKS